MRTILIASLCMLLIQPALARDGSKSVSGDGLTGHSRSSSKDKSVYQGLREELKHLDEPIDPVNGGVTYGDQFLGDVNNALSGETNATGTPDITAGQAKSLEKAFDRATSGTQSRDGNFSGKSGAIGSDDIGGIP